MAAIWVVRGLQLDELLPSDTLCDLGLDLVEDPLHGGEKCEAARGELVTVQYLLGPTDATLRDSRDCSAQRLNGACGGSRSTAPDRSRALLGRSSYFDLKNSVDAGC